MKSFLTLLKREYWEHKTGMFWVPTIVGGLMVFGVMLAVFVLSNDNIKINGFGEHDLTNLFKSYDAFVDPNVKAISVQMANYSYVMSFSLVLAIVSFFYCLGSLYDDRKDKSILFWKSLPVSDANTVFSKVVTVMVVMPLVYWVIMQVTMLLIMLLATIFAWISGASAWDSVWGPSNYFVISLSQLGALYLAILWIAPIVGFCLLVSSWTKKVPFLVAIVPMFILIMIEGIIFNTSKILIYIGERFLGVWQALWSPVIDIFEGTELHGLEELRRNGFIGDTFIDQLASVDLWAGMVLGAVFVAGAIMIRRYRDEAF